MLTLIVACARNGAIGKDGAIPWHAPADLALFQRETTGGALIMGRRTWESLPKKPLPRRLNIVVTRQAMPAIDGAVFLPMDAALDVAKSSGIPRIYGIGGAGIYAALLPIADRLLITQVDIDIDGADTFFPGFSPAEWREIARYPLGGAPDATAIELLRR